MMGSCHRTSAGFTLNGASRKWDKLILGRAFVAAARLSGGRSMTLQVRDLHEGEAEDLGRATHSRTLGVGVVRRAQIVQHAVDGLSPPEIAVRLDVCKASVLAQAVQRAGSARATRGGALRAPADLHARRAPCRHHRRAEPTV